MLKKILIGIIIIASIFFSISFLKLEKKEGIQKTIELLNPVKIGKARWIEVEQPVGRIIIPKIRINQPLYNMNSEKNNVEENVTILKGSIAPNEPNSIMFIAAHSGTGKIAYFENLDDLKENDEVILEWNQEKYYYTIKNIYEQPKDGYINGKIEKKKQLVLTTCCPKKNNCQLIINCIQKES